MGILSAAVINEIKKPSSKVFRRLMIKRRVGETGAFEDNWLDITNDVKKFGTIKYEADSRFLSRFRFPTVSFVVANDTGLFNPETSPYSHWYGYLTRQRTLVKIEAGFITETDNGDGTWTRTEVPSSDSVIFTGIISGDILETDENEVTFTAAPMAEVFRQYPAKNLTGYNTSLTASDFVTMVRDQVDANGSPIFLPFFGNTTTGFSIQSTTVEYADLSTSTNEDLRDMTVWAVIEQLAESESFMPIVTRDGRFRFVSREANTTTAAFIFNGLGVYDYSYGHTIKKINFLGPRPSKFYTRVSVQHDTTDTATSFHVVESTLTVSPPSISWQYGQRTFSIQNSWIPNATVAASIAQAVFDDYSALKREVDFTTTFVPGIDLLDQVEISYDISRFVDPENLWDVGEWADSIGAAETGYELIWDPLDGLAIYLNREEFTIISTTIDLDKMECRFVGRET
jgi:hypothetical protein